jgi:hypothetical protein
VLGQVYLALNQPQEAIAAFEKSRGLLADRDPYEAARTRMELGLALRAGGVHWRGEANPTLCRFWGRAGV